MCRWVKFWQHSDNCIRYMSIPTVNPSCHSRSTISESIRQTPTKLSTDTNTDADAMTAMTLNYVWPFDPKIWGTHPCSENINAMLKLWWNEYSNIQDVVPTGLKIARTVFKIFDRKMALNFDPKILFIVSGKVASSNTQPRSIMLPKQGLSCVSDRHKGNTAAGF